MTFKPNVPERWLERPEQLPYNKFTQINDQKKASLTTTDIPDFNSGSIGHKKAKSMSLSQTMLGENFHSFGAKVTSDADSNNNLQISQQMSSHRKKSNREIKQIDKILQQYSPFQQFENEKDKEDRLKQLMQKAGRFAVAPNEGKSHIRATGTGNSISLAKTSLQQHSARETRGATAEVDF